MHVAGGLEEMVEELSSGKVMYAFCKVQVSNSSLPKFVFINWVNSTRAQLQYTHKHTNQHTHTYRNNILSTLNTQIIGLCPCVCVSVCSDWWRG